MRCSTIALAILFLVMVTAAATAANEPLTQPDEQQHHSLLPPLHIRKLLQYGSNRRYRNRDSGQAQLARNSAAIVNSQYAIRSAVESGANPYVTRGATYYAQDQAQQAVYGVGPYPYGRWWGYGKRRS